MPICLPLYMASGSDFVQSFCDDSTKHRGGEPDCVEVALATLFADLQGAIATVLAVSRLEQSRVHLVMPSK